MAQKTTVDLIDDIDGSPAEYANLPFALDGISYEIDLSEANAERLRELLQDFVAKARRMGGRAKLRSVGIASTSRSYDAAKVREWALANGYELSDRGRIPNHIVMAYNDAQTAEAKPAKTPRATPNRRARAKRVG